jgi:hypothetical protein
MTSVKMTKAVKADTANHRQIFAASAIMSVPEVKVAKMATAKLYLRVRVAKMPIVRRIRSAKNINARYPRPNVHKTATAEQAKPVAMASAQSALSTVFAPPVTAIAVANNAMIEISAAQVKLAAAHKIIHKPIL